MKSVGVVGASGYGGTELLRILSHHPGVTVTYVAGNHEGDAPMAEEYPYLHRTASLTLAQFDRDACARQCDSVFVALPSGASGKIAAELWRMGKQVIDLSGDLRLPASEYEIWYEKEPAPSDAVEAAVYGLTEWDREGIQAANLIANPGCFATTTLLALLPAVKEGLCSNGAPIYVDAKSGVSGAGRGANLSRQLAELADNFYPYRVGRHQHTPEVERILERVAGGRSPQVLMTTQLLPIVRGIMASCYIQLDREMTTGDVYEIYQSTYATDPFVHVLPQGRVPELKHVRGSNDTLLSVHVDSRTRTLQVFSVLDNLQKGAAGQAVQNWNLMNGWPEETALTTPALYP